MQKGPLPGGCRTEGLVVLFFGSVCLVDDPGDDLVAVVVAHMVEHLLAGDGLLAQGAFRHVYSFFSLSFSAR